MNQEKIGKFIAKCRRDKNITQEDLATRLGVTNKSVSRWENGKNMPDYSILKELCNILEIDVNDFLNGEKVNKNSLVEISNANLDMILKEYYMMKKRKDRFKVITILSISFLYPILVILLPIVLLISGYNNRLHIVTNKSEYNNVIGISANKYYNDKWGMNEDIFPKTINDLNVKEFKMINDDFLDNQYLSYLIVEYDEDDYIKEINRLKEYGIEEYTDYYEVTGFSNYELLAMNSDEYYGFIYAITDGEKEIIYVELIFCNYTMDIDYDNEILKEYLPDNFNAKEDNSYRLKMLKQFK